MSYGESVKLSVPADVLSRVLGGEAVLLHLGSGMYFGMNEVASRAWEEIVKGASFGALIETLHREFEVERSALESDLERFVRALDEKGLVVIA
jgi:hypothetical protein